MKISKLFHWLYAFLMFLPVLSLAPSLFYFAFNQQSQNYTDVQVTETYEYETNEVNSVDDLVVGNIYHFKFNNTLLYYEEYEIKSNMFYKVTGVSQDYRAFNEIDIRIDNLEEEYTLRFYSAPSTSLFTVARYDEINAINKTTYLTDYMNSYTEFEFYFIYTSTITIPNINLIRASDYLGEKTVDVVRSEQSPMNIFYTAVNYVYDVPVFSWAKNSFLALPITYITGLFGMASNNVVNYYLSYWLAISIVYLAFDLVMYVPLLVHRWIDKGIIE